MEVYALFDDKNAEQIILKFLQPYSKSSRVEITCLDSVPDNVRESCDKGVKEAFVMLSNCYSKKIPEKISIWFRGLENHVQGNSMDLAFAAALIAELNDTCNLKEYTSSKVLFATGVIDKYSEIANISGLKEKVLSAIKACKENHDNIMVFPAENMEELQLLRESDAEFDEEINLSTLRLIPVKSLKDLLNVFEFEGTSTVRIPKWAALSISGVVIALLSIFLVLLYIKINPSSNTSNNKDNYTLNALNTTSKEQITGKNYIDATSTLISTPLSNSTHMPSDTPVPVITGKAEYTINPGMASIAAPYTKAGVLPSTSHSSALVTISPTDNQNQSDKIKITAISPSNGETVDLEKTKFKITFSEPGISKGPNFDRIYVSGGKGRVLDKSIESNSQTLTLSLWVKYDSIFTLNIPEGAISSGTNNINQTQSFTFRSRESDLSFEIISTKPSNGQVNVSLNSQVKITFNEIGLEAGANFNSISIDNGARITEKKFENSSETVILYLAGLKPNTKYTINIPKGSFDNGTGILNKAYTLTFTTSGEQV